jgi:hypothetical protein
MGYGGTILIPRSPHGENSVHISFNISLLSTPKSRDSSVGIALGYGLDDGVLGFDARRGAGNFSLHHRVQNASGAHPASYLMGTRGSFPGGKAPGV